DGHALIYRAFHALPPLSTTQGELTNAVFGFTSMVLKAVQDLQPRYIACTFDRPKPTFRHEQFKEYKAQRPPMPSELSSQIKRVRDVVSVLCLPVFEMDGYEADDLIGTLSKQAADAGVLATIVTGDLDTLQLVGPRVRVYAPRGRMSDIVVYDEDKVRERFGIEPIQTIDFKALKGDPSDNIPGVPGFGEKTASDLVARFGSIEGIYEHLAEVKGKQHDLLAEYEEQVRFGKHLATIVDAPGIILDLEACRRPDYDRAAAVDLFRELEFNSLVPRLPRSSSSSPAAGMSEPSGPLYGSAPVARQTSMFDVASATPATDGAATPASQSETRESVDKPAASGPAGGPVRSDLADLASELRSAGSFSLKVVGTRPQAMETRLLGIAVAYGTTAYVDLSEDASALQGLKEVLEDESVGKIGHDLKFDLLVLRRQGIELKGITFDSAIAYFLASTNRTPNLKDVSLQKLHEELTCLVDLTGTGAKAVPLSSLPLDQVAEAACREAECVRRVAPILERELREKTLYQLLLEVELPLIPVLAEMEFNGIGVNTRFLGDLAQEMDARIRELEREIYDEVGHQFTIGSTQQLAGVLFGELHLPGGKRTKTGYSTDASVLEELVDAHPVVAKVLEWRQLGKLKSTYLDALPGLINQETGRVHTSFSQVTATTGRLSSSEPNLQNIPIRTDLGTRIRQAFEPGDRGWSLLAADYSQIELRILAHVTEDDNLIGAFQRLEDIHASTASFVFKVPMNQVTADMRRVAKMVNFGIAYGLSDFGLARGTGMSRVEAAEFIKGYFDTYPGIQHYMRQTKRDAAELGYVCTLLNRRRYIPDIHAANFQLRSGAERMAINMPIQGTAADIIKLAMIRLLGEMREKGVRSKMILQVHDELVFEVPPEEIDSMAAMVRQTMEGALSLAVPLTVDVKVGPNWGQMEPIKAPGAALSVA
ncbi:MAG: DNA polymerase I, partial [Chloroflexi bacterium]|nr:DNA polymerase I [Chloroflexota bacterium]